MRSFHMWITFIVAITITISTVFIVHGFLVVVFANAGLLVPDQQPTVWFPFMGIMFAACSSSIVVTILVSRYFFKPISQLVKALNEVAAGNFTVQLPESTGEASTNEMNVNFNKMVKELNSTEMLKTDFIQNVSHEIKTPLAAIEGYAFLLKSADLPQVQHQYTIRILDSAKQLSTLTGNILMLSKLENQQFVAEKKNFSLDEQVRQVVLAMEPLWSKKKINIDIDLPVVSYYGKEDLMIQVWTNLLSNAIKFTPKNGEISVRIEKQADAVIVEFCDTGIGMTEDVQAHIFDKFYQGELSRSMAGNGLGLALVKKILGLCGGDVTVKSEPGMGSVFRVVLYDKSKGR